MPEQPASAASISFPLPGAVLIVEDDRINRTLLARHVERMGRRVLVAENGREAVEMLGREKCDLVLLDMMMPEMDGREFLALITQRSEWRSIPVIVISGMTEAETAAQCIEVGAEDFLTKPYNPLLLQARITASLEKKRLRDQEAAYLSQVLELQQSLDRRNRELEELNSLLARAALTDSLTGLPNRRWAMDELQRCWMTSTRHHSSMAVLLIDVDHFKRFNDNFGHHVGDEVLKGVALRLREATRKHEGVARIGGEEFVVLCEFSDANAAMGCAERLRSAVAGTPIAHEGREHAITISIGVAVRDDSTADPDELLKNADRAVYAAKQAGRNRVALAPGRS